MPQFFGLETPDEVAEAIHVGRLDGRRMTELPPLVFAEAEHDVVAAEIVERLTFEIVAFVRASLTRLALTQEHVQVALGGGVACALDERVIELIEAELHEVGPHIELRLTSSPPVLGAALCCARRARRRPGRARPRARRARDRRESRWLTSASTRRHASIRETTSRPSTRST